MANTPIRALLVGCGGICRAWLNSIKDCNLVQIAGLVDLNPASMQKVADEYQFKVPQETDLTRALVAVQPDVVFDCTVPEAHVKVTLAALKHGCHVLGEKPLADSMANARRMVAACAKSGKLYAVIQNRRYLTPIRALRAFLDGGAIGRVTTVNADFYIGAHFGGFRDRMKHVLLLDMAIHSFDQARLIAGADPVSVYCHEWNPAGSWYDHDASAQCIFAMTDGLVFNYRGSWCSEGLNTAWECQWRIVGERGTVIWNGGNDLKCQRVVRPAGFNSELEDVAIPVACPPERDGGHRGVILEFLNCVRSGGTPETICRDNIKSLAMVFGAVRSAETGRRVPIKI